MTSAVTAQLILIQGDSQHFQQVIDLRSSNVSIGRAQNCDIIWGSLQISRRHATMEFLISKWYIRDTSTNGLSVNGNKCVKGELCLLKDTDIISFIPTGTVRYRFRYVTPVSPSRPIASSSSAGRQNNSISPQPSSSITSTLSSARRVPVDIMRTESSSIEILSDNNNSDSEDSNHSESLLSLDNPADDYFYSFSGDEQRSSPSVIPDPDSEGSSSPPLSKRKHNADSSDSDSGVMERKKKKVHLISCSDEDEPLNDTSSNKSDVPVPSTSSKFKIVHRNQEEELTEDQIEKIDDVKKLQQLLKKCTQRLGSTEISLKSLELEMNIEREEFRKKESDVQSVNTAFKEETYKKILELMESELSCAVCNEIFIQATVIDCGHTFCSFCINEWGRKKQECPICRKAFRNRSRHIEMENFISRMLDSFSSEISIKRNNSIKDREDQVKKAADDAARAAAEQQQARAGGGGNIHAFFHATAERYVDFLAELHQINEILAPRTNGRGNIARRGGGGNGGDRRRSARIQERVVDGVAATGGAGRARSRAHAARAGPGLPQQPAINEEGGFRGVFINGNGNPIPQPPPRHRNQGPGVNAPVPVVTLNDSNDDNGNQAPAGTATIRFPNQFINYVRHIPMPVPMMSNSRSNRNGNAPNQ